MTSKPAILATEPVPPLLVPLLEAHYLVHRLPRAPDAVVPEAARDVPVLVTSGPVGASAALIAALPRLGLIALHGAGYDRIDLAAARARGIIVTNTPDVLTDDVADMALALMLAAIRRIASSDRWLRDGHWQKGERLPFARRVTGQRFGILGLGRIGRAIAARLVPFARGDILYHNRHPVADVPYRYVGSALELARESDVLLIATSGGAEAAALVDAAVIEALGPAGTLVNVARGSVVDQPALVAALAEGRLGAAGLDVFVDEPNVPQALLALPNVVLQPHQASATVEAREGMARCVAENVRLYLAGAALLSPVA